MTKRQRWMGARAVAIAAACLGATLCLGADEPSTSTNSSAAGVYVKVLIAAPVKLSKLKPGDIVEGNLSRDVYSSGHKVFSVGSSVRLSVDHLEKRKRKANDHWPWIVNVFTPRHENYPVFKSATVEQASGGSSFDVSLISASRMREVHAKAKSTKSGAVNEPGAVEASKANFKNVGTTMVLEATGIADTAAEKADESADTSAIRPETLPAGTRCKILLLGDVSASKSRAGDAVQARLLEPVMLNSTVILPAGSFFEGKVVKKTPPRWLSRAGSLYLTFTDLTLPEGRRVPIAATLAGAELDTRSHTKMDAEGRLHGDRPGAAWMAINLGVSAGIAKEVDDSLQLIIEAIISTATDASTAGTSRIVASAASGLYMVTRKGRDVVLPRFTEMDISLDRPVLLNPEAHVETASAGGK